MSPFITRVGVWLVLLSLGSITVVRAAQFCETHEGAIFHIRFGENGTAEKKLPAGTRLTVLGEKDDNYEVRDERGMQGTILKSDTTLVAETATPTPEAAPSPVPETVPTPTPEARNRPPGEVAKPTPTTIAPLEIKGQKGYLDYSGIKFSTDLSKAELSRVIDQMTKALNDRFLQYGYEDSEPLVKETTGLLQKVDHETCLGLLLSKIPGLPATLYAKQNNTPPPVLLYNQVRFAYLPQVIEHLQKPSDKDMLFEAALGQVFEVAPNLLKREWLDDPRQLQLIAQATDPEKYTRSYPGPAMDWVIRLLQFSRQEKHALAYLGALSSKNNPTNTDVFYLYQMCILPDIRGLIKKNGAAAISAQLTHRSGTLLLPRDLAKIGMALGDKDSLNTYLRLLRSANSNWKDIKASNEGVGNLLLLKKGKGDPLQVLMKSRQAEWNEQNWVWEVSEGTSDSAER